MSNWKKWKMSLDSMLLITGVVGGPTQTLEKQRHTADIYGKLKQLE
jgi:hypothetical protein